MKKIFITIALVLLCAALYSEKKDFEYCEVCCYALLYNGEQNFLQEQYALKKQKGFFTAEHDVIIHSRDVLLPYYYRMFESAKADYKEKAKKNFNLKICKVTKEECGCDRFVDDKGGM